MYDIIVIGGGPAGLTAALYALRANKSVLIIEKGTFGGQITYSPKVENYPGFISLSGNELADKLVEQVLSQGAEVEMDTVTAVEKQPDGITVTAEGGTFRAKSVIIATGARHRMLGLDGEEKLVGEGISFCAVCDGAFYKGKEVAVVGGGNSALQEAILLCENASKVTLIQNLDFLTGEERLANQLKAKPNAEIILGTTVSAVNGGDTLKSVTLHDEKDGTEREMKLDGLFIAIGLVPQNEPFSDLVGLDKYGYVSATEDCRTSTEGIFTAGDCRTKRIRQVTTAAGDGAIAALAACGYIDSL